MVKTRLERISTVEDKIEKLKDRKREMLKQNRKHERKERNHRIFRRGGYLESKLPETISLTDEQYYSFLEQTLFNQYSQRILNGFIKQNEENALLKVAEAEKQSDDTETSQPTVTELDDDDYDSEDEEYGELEDD